MQTLNTQQAALMYQFALHHYRSTVFCTGDAQEANKYLHIIHENLKMVPRPIPS